MANFIHIKNGDEIPDPQKQPVPKGWWDTTFTPVVDAIDIWDDLDEVEARLLGYASAYEAMGLDVLELEKAMRIVEKRRGELLGPTKQGTRHDLQLLPHAEEVVIPFATASRYRQIARHWDELYPYLLEQETRSLRRRRSTIKYRCSSNGYSCAEAHTIRCFR